MPRLDGGTVAASVNLPDEYTTLDEDSYVWSPSLLIGGIVSDLVAAQLGSRLLRLGAL